ncbi:MAG: hypothetical protein Hals2KO_15690 [Halioglobus sp.]
MLLDETADIIRREGVANLSLERIAQSAGVSKSLVYTYFDSLLELLQELLDRELKALRRLQLEGAEKATTFEQLVRNITHAYLTYIEDRGLIIERLQAEPSVSGIHDPTDYSRSGAVDYLAPILAKHFDMPLDQAKAATDISFGLPSAAGQFLLHNDMSREVVEELTVNMIIGSITQWHSSYLAKQRELER